MGEGEPGRGARQGAELLLALGMCMAHPCGLSAEFLMFLQLLEGSLLLMEGSGALQGGLVKSLMWCWTPIHKCLTGLR